MTLKVMREEGGVRGLYRGLVATAVGVAPYVGINFAAYEALRGLVTPPGKSTVPRKLTCGALAGALLSLTVLWCLFTKVLLGSISQTLTYPFDVLRRKMQVAGMSQSVLGYKYNGALEALKEIVRSEGIVGLYRGLWPNLREQLPAPSDVPVLIRVDSYSQGRAKHCHLVRSYLIEVPMARANTL
jgi:solute carrier family 25 (mitochondrial phosphate transporter), member 23/24/25/41